MKIIVLYKFPSSFHLKENSLKFGTPHFCKYERKSQKSVPTSQKLFLEPTHPRGNRNSLKNDQKFMGVHTEKKNDGNIMWSPSHLLGDQNPLLLVTTKSSVFSTRAPVTSLKCNRSARMVSPSAGSWVALSLVRGEQHGGQAEHAWANLARSQKYGALGWVGLGDRGTS